MRQTGIQDLAILATMRPPWAPASHIHQCYSSKVWDIPICPWRLLKGNPKRKRMQQKLEESRIYQPQRFWKGSLEKKEKKNSRNSRSTHPTFLPVLGQVHKTIDRILWENEAERSTKGCQEQESAHFWFALSRPNVASHHSCLQVLEKNAFKRKAEIQDLPIQSSFFEVFEQEALKGK